MALCKPDRYFSRITHIDIQQDLIDCGLTYVLLDIDNTIRSRETGSVPDDVLDWLLKAQEMGVTICLLSNNWHANVHQFASTMGLPIVAKACKPLPMAYVAALKKVGGTRATAVVIGDQLSTDVIGAHALGIASYLVVPLAKKDLKHMVMLRKIERKLIGNTQPE